MKNRSTRLKSRFTMRLTWLKSIMALTHRNIIASFDMMFIVWQVILPLVMIFVGGYSYSTLVDSIGIGGHSNVNYPAFLTAGIIGYNVVWTCIISGNVVLNDRINGMFDQIMGMPFTRSQYILSNLSTIVLLGLVGAIVIIVIGIPTFIGYAHISLLGVLYILFAIVTCSIIFGSLVVSISLKFDNFRALAFQVESGIINGFLQFVSFSSSVFYPTAIVPEPLREIFLINPLTHVVNIIRDSLFFGIDYNTTYSVAFLGIISLFTAVVSVIIVNKAEAK